jgi:hypothetical protein
MKGLDPQHENSLPPAVRWIRKISDPGVNEQSKHRLARTSSSAGIILINGKTPYLVTEPADLSQFKTFVRLKRTLAQLKSWLLTSISPFGRTRYELTLPSTNAHVPPNPFQS